MNNTGEAWQDGYDAGYAAGRRAAEGEQEQRGGMTRAERYYQETRRDGMDYEGLGGYGSQER